MRLSQILLLPLALATPVLADLVIEQEINNKGTGMDMDMRMVLQVKGDQARMDIGDQMSTLIDGKTGDMTTLMHGQKVYMKMGGDQLKTMAEQFAPEASGDDAQIQPLVATGNKETINGHATEEFTHEVAGNRINYWIARDYPNHKSVLAQMTQFQQGIGQVAKSGSAMAPDPDFFPGMPIRTVVALATGGTVTTTMVSIEEKDLDASLFQLPEGYKGMNMPSFAPPTP